ncbi:hypothetical protein bcere0004_55810 [Bacillus cereus BGSC 6E1]|nr:hypothetical protein bcere0004_55810 [Bacillus cereus BGSC 6E1]
MKKHISSFKDLKMLKNELFSKEPLCPIVHILIKNCLFFY